MSTTSWPPPVLVTWPIDDKLQGRGRGRVTELERAAACGADIDAWCQLEAGELDRRRSRTRSR